jgi:AcrR family transcriptional regulator
MSNNPKDPVGGGLDRRTRRTREALRAAMMGLMADRGWDDIDVQSLCERADVGRSTFYQHYANKEELLTASFSDLRAFLLADAARRTDLGALAFLPGLLAHAQEAQAVFRALLRRRSGQFVQDRFRELLVDLVQSSMQAMPVAPNSSWRQEVRVHYMGAAIFEVLVWWIGENRLHHANDVERLLLQLCQVVSDLNVD